MSSSRPAQNGVMLLEALVAILLISFGILGLIALWAASLKGASEAKYRTDASFLANEMIGQLWLNRPTAPAPDAAPQYWKDRVTATLPGGDGAIVVDVDPDVPSTLRTTVTIRWTLPGGTQHKYVSIAQINGAI